MYSFKVINHTIANKTFKESCLYAMNDAKFRLGRNSYIPNENSDGVFCCDGTTTENLEVINSIKTYFFRNNFIEGRDFTINILMES